jgi:hypothetical protein
MSEHSRPSLLGGAIRGLIAGTVATWLMDLTTTGLVDGQSEEDKQQEAAAQANGKSSVGNLLDRIQAMSGIQLGESAQAIAPQVVHYSLGAVPGAFYGAFRHRIPGLRAANGLLYGLIVFVANDEVMNTELGLAGRYEAYPLSTHWRGLVGHAVLGIATDTGLDVLGA